MVITGARMANRTVDVLDGDRHEYMKNRNSWSWTDMELMHESPIYYGIQYGHPKNPWFAGQFKRKMGYELSQVRENVDLNTHRRLTRGKSLPSPGFGKKAMEEAKRRAKEAAKAAGGGKKKGK